MTHRYRGTAASLLLFCGLTAFSLIALSGCARKAAPPPAAAPVASLQSQIDSDPHLTPDQKAAMKQKIMSATSPTH